MPVSKLRGYIAFDFEGLTRVNLQPWSLGKTRAGASESQDRSECYRGALGSYDFAAASTWGFLGRDAGSKLLISVAVRDAL